MKMLLWNTVALLIIGMACYLAATGKPGWGWFLFVGVLFGVAPHVDSNKKKKE